MFIKKANNIYEQLNKVLMFYFPSLATYWDSITLCQVENKVTNFGRYYLNFESKYYYPGNFSSNGIPIYKLNSNKEIYQPTVICQYALGIFELLNKKNFEDKKLNEQFINQANWLLNNQINLKYGASWYLNFDVPEYGLKQPWISALTQGEAISVLCRAYWITGKNIFLNAAEKALMPFQYNVSEGGLRNHFENIPVYEEYPSRKTNAVLNGFIFSLYGLFDLYLVSDNSSAKELFDQGIESLIKLVKYYDTGYWSQYNLYRYPQKYLSSYKYHILHIEQLKSLYLITSNKIFYNYYTRWDSCNKSLKKKTKALIIKLIS